MKIFYLKYDTKKIKQIVLIAALITCFNYVFALAFISTIAIYFMLINREYKVIAFDEYIEVTLLPNKFLKEKKCIINKSDIKDIICFCGVYIVKQNKINVSIPYANYVNNEEFNLYMKDLISELSASNLEFSKNKVKAKKYNKICFITCEFCAILAGLLLFYGDSEKQLWCGPILIFGYFVLLIDLIYLIKKK